MVQTDHLESSTGGLLSGRGLIAAMVGYTGAWWLFRSLQEVGSSDFGDELLLFVAGGSAWGPRFERWLIPRGALKLLLLFHTFSVLCPRRNWRDLNLAKLTKEPSARYQILLWSQRGTKVKQATSWWHPSCCVHHHGSWNRVGRASGRALLDTRNPQITVTQPCYWLLRHTVSSIYTYCCHYLIQNTKRLFL